MKQFLYFLFFAAVLAAGCKKTDKEAAPPLSVTSFLPNSGNPGTVVTIHGTGFSKVLQSNAVTFNGTAAQVMNANDTTLWVASPEKGATGAIAVTVGGHSVTGGTYTYQALSVHGITPNNGPAGTSVTISGAGFTSLDSPAVVTVNGIRAIVSSANDTSLIITVPVGASTGPIHISVNGQAADGPVFNFNAISAIKPASGNTGTQVVITGSGFSANASEDVVQFNGKTATVVSATATTLTVIAPASVQSGPVSVTIGGQKTAGPVFTMVPPPVITALAPLSGPVGTLVTLTGNFYSSLTDEDVILLNGAPVKIQSAATKQLTFTVPAGAASGPIALNVNGQSITGPDFTVQALGISSLSPDNGLDGTIVTIKGIGFDVNPANDQLTINGQSISVTAATDTTLTVTIPAGFTSGQMKLVVGSLTALSPMFTKAGVVTFYTGAGVMSNAVGIAVDSKGNVYVAGLSQINKISADGASYSVFAGSSASGNQDGQGSGALFFNVSGLTIDAQDNLWVLDGANRTIRRVTPDGTVKTMSQGPSYTPKYCTIDNQTGDIYFGSDYSGMGKWSPSGAITTVSGFQSPQGSMGYNNGYVYYGTNGATLMKMQVATGTGTILAGQNFNSGFVDGPQGVNRIGSVQSAIFDPISGLVYFIDGYAYAIRAASPDDGTVTTITGAGGTYNQFTSGYKDGTLKEALFSVSGNSPLCVDKSGNIYVVDGGFAGRIRKILLH